MIGRCGQLLKRWRLDCFAGLLPMFHGAGNLVNLRRPIVQGGGIEICAVGPYQGVNLGVQPDLFKQAQVAQRPVKFA